MLTCGSDYIVNKTSLFGYKPEIDPHFCILVNQGGTPYPTITNQRLPTALNSGYRMGKPDMCSEEM